MLQRLNERIQGFIAWLVIILIALTFTLFGVDYYMQSHHTNDAAVTVNDEFITKHALEINYRRTRQQQDPAQITAANEIALKQQVLNAMIVNQITVQAARLAGFEVNAEQANAAIVSIPQFQQDGHFSAERYKLALSGAMFTPETFQKEVKQGMLLNQQRFAFIGTSFVLPNEIKRFTRLYMQTRDYDYLQISTAMFINHEQVAEPLIQQYYQQHKQEFIEPEKVSIDYVVVSLSKVKESLKITDEDIQHYYQENQNNFLKPAKWQVAHILFAIPDDADEEMQNKVQEKAEEAWQALQNNPGQFNEWVKTLSADKLSTDGVLPWIAAGSTEFDKALSGLTKPGQLSAPLKTKHGYELFKLIAYKPAKLKTLAQVKAQIADQLQNEMAQAKYAELLEQLTELSYQNPDSLEPIAKELKLPLQQTDPFSRSGGSSEITQDKQIINAAFSQEVREIGNNSEPIQLNNESVVVLRVKKYFPATQKLLTEVKQSIIKILALKQAEEKAEQLGKKLLLNQENSQQEITNNKLIWRHVEVASRDSDKVDPLINDIAFSLPRPNNIDGRRLVNGDFVLVRLKKINNGQYKLLDKEQQASLAQQIEASYGLMDYDIYVNNLVRNAKIERH